MSTDWWSAGQRWLEQQASKEADSQKRAWIKAGRSAKTFRYNPPEWHRDAVAALGRNDEETFKAIKLDQLGTQGLPPLRAPKRRDVPKKSPAQLQREIDEVLAGTPASDITPDKLKYAQERANATGRSYVISNMGHVMVADANNKRAVRDELGGIAAIVKPARS